MTKSTKSTKSLGADAVSTALVPAPAQAAQPAEPVSKLTESATPAAVAQYLAAGVTANSALADSLAHIAGWVDFGALVVTTTEAHGAQTKMLLAYGAANGLDFAAGRDKADAEILEKLATGIRSVYIAREPSRFYARDGVKLQWLGDGATQGDYILTAKDAVAYTGKQLKSMAKTDAARAVEVKALRERIRVRTAVKINYLFEAARKDAAAKAITDSTEPGADKAEGAKRGKKEAKPTAPLTVETLHGQFIAQIDGITAAVGAGKMTKVFADQLTGLLVQLRDATKPAPVQPATK